MPIDAGIYSQANRPTVELESPQNALMRSAQLQSAQNQNKLFNMQVQDASEAKAAKNALAAAYQNSIDPTTGAIDYTKLSTGLASGGQGQAVPGILKQKTEQEKAAQEAKKAQIETHLKTLDVVSQSLGPTLQNPALYPQVKAALAQQYPEGAANLPEQFDAATIQSVINKALTAKDQVQKQQEADKLTLAKDKFAYDKTNDAANRAVTLNGQKLVNDRSIEANTGKTAENSMALRKEFDQLPEVKNYKQALPSYRGIEDAVKRNTPMSDINIVYGIAKLYDPNSVVREGEYSTVANSPAIPERIKGYAQYLAGGGKLTDTVKKQILTEAKSRMGTFEDQYTQARAGYEDIASNSKADKKLVFPKPQQPAITPAAGAPAKIVSDADYNKLPSGAEFIAPDGSHRRKP